MNSHNLVSIVIPLYNESENIKPLFARLQETLSKWDHPWEAILVDDGSNDETLTYLREEAKNYSFNSQIIQLQRNFGQTAAMQAGIDQACGEFIITMDGDLQNDPADIPGMVKHLIKNDLDLLSGWRRKRQDKLLLRKIPSKIANWLIRSVTNVRIHDYGCSLKVYRASVLKKIRLYGEMHRFIPAWVASVTSPSRIGEVEVQHNPRTQGTSKYGISRVFRVISDLLTVLFFLRYQSRPGHFFGAFGLFFGIIGFFILSYLGIIKFGFGEDIGSRPLLFVGVLSIIASLQFFTTGVLTELLVRNYFASSNKTHYVIRIHESQSTLVSQTEISSDKKSTPAPE